MEKRIKYCLAPTERQKDLLDRTFDYCLLVYNEGIKFREEQHAAGKPAGLTQTGKMLTRLKRKPVLQFLTDVDSQALMGALYRLDGEYQKFFNHTARHPEIKTQDEYGKYYVTHNTVGQLRVENGFLRLPKVGLVKTIQALENMPINRALISKDESGQYYASVDYE